MDAATYQTMQSRLELIAQIAVDTDPKLLDEFIQAGEHSDTIAPFLDPTAWIAGHDRLRSVIDHARALAKFRRAVGGV